MNFNQAFGHPEERPYFPASLAAWCSHITKIWPTRCKKHYGQLLAHIPKVREYTPLCPILLPGGWNGRHVARAAIMDQDRKATCWGWRNLNRGGTWVTDIMNCCTSPALTPSAFLWDRENKCQLFIFTCSQTSSKQILPSHPCKGNSYKSRRLFHYTKPSYESRAPF